MELRAQLKDEIILFRSVLREYARKVHESAFENIESEIGRAAEDLQAAVITLREKARIRFSRVLSTTVQNILTMSGGLSIGSLLLNQSFNWSLLIAGILISGLKTYTDVSKARDELMRGNGLSLMVKLKE